MRPEPAQVTVLLKAWADGDASALDRLTPLVYEELRRLAGAQMRREGGSGHAMQPTALVHEAYLRLVNIEEVAWTDRVHFFAVCARIMRRILIDDARKRRSAKRGGDIERDAEASARVDELPALDPERWQELCAIDDALTSLAQIDARRAQVVELRFFGGLSVNETAQALKVSPQTVMRDWRLARAWLTRELRRE